MLQQIPVKPIVEDMTDPPLGYVVYRCPACKNVIDRTDDDGMIIDYCEHCFQPIDWSEIDQKYTRRWGTDK